MFDKTSGYHSVAMFTKLTMEATMFSANKGKLVTLEVKAKDLCLDGKNSITEVHSQPKNGVLP